MLISSSRKSNNLTISHYFAKNGTIADQFTVVAPKSDEWKIALLLSLSQIFFFISLALMVYLACKHKPVRQHSTLMDPLTTNTVEI